MRALIESRALAAEKRGELAEELGRQGIEVVAEGPADFAMSMEKGKGAAELWLASDAPIELLRWAQGLATSLGGTATRGYPGNPAGDFAFNCTPGPSVVVRAGEAPDAVVLARKLCGWFGVPYVEKPAEPVQDKPRKAGRKDKTEEAEPEDIG